MIHAALLVTVALNIALVSARPSSVKCNMENEGGNPNPAVNIMTTTAAIMGNVPVDSTTVVTADTTEVAAGGTVTLTFGTEFGNGVIQASAGTFNAPEFTETGTPIGDACIAPAVIARKYAAQATATSPVTWTAPTTPGTITINVVGTQSYAAGLARRSLTINVGAAAPTGTGTQTGLTGSQTGTSGFGSTVGSSGTGQTRGYGMVGGCSAWCLSLATLAICMLVTF